MFQNPINEDKAVTAVDEASYKTKDHNLVSGLFFESNFDADLKLIIEAWQQLSTELKQAIVKMVQ